MILIFLIILWCHSVKCLIVFFGHIPSAWLSVLYFFLYFPHISSPFHSSLRQNLFPRQHSSSFVISPSRFHLPSLLSHPFIHHFPLNIVFSNNKTCYIANASPPPPPPHTPFSAGQVLPGSEPVQRGGGLLHPRGGPGPGHAGGPGWVLLQVTGRSQAHEGGP